MQGYATLAGRKRRRLSPRGEAVRTNSPARRNTSARAPISPQVAAVRRRVWTVRIAFILTVVLIAFAYNTAMNMRSASLRRPETALADSGQVYADALEWLSSHMGQLTLQATAAEYRGVRTGPLHPGSSTVQNLSGRWYLRVSNAVSASEYGEPVVSPVQFVLKDYRTNGGELVTEITLECAYSVCWDRTAKQPRQLAAGEELPLPDRSEVFLGNMTRYSDGLDVVDRVVLHMDHRALKWKPSLVERLTSEIRR